MTNSLIKLVCDNRKNMEVVEEMFKHILATSYDEEVNNRLTEMFLSKNLDAFKFRAADMDTKKVREYIQKNTDNEVIELISVISVDMITGMIVVEYTYHPVVYFEDESCTGRSRSYKGDNYQYRKVLEKIYNSTMTIKYLKEDIYK